MCVISEDSSSDKKGDIEWKNETFWTDSKVVLGYMNNNTKKFKIFVAN